MIRKSISTNTTEQQKTSPPHIYFAISRLLFEVVTPVLSVSTVCAIAQDWLTAQQHKISLVCDKIYCDCVPRCGLTYKDAVESAIIKIHGTVQFNSLRLVLPRLQYLVSRAWTKRKKLIPGYAPHRGHKSKKTRTDEPSSLLPAHCSCIRVGWAVPRFVQARLEECRTGSDEESSLRVWAERGGAEQHWKERWEVASTFSFQGPDCRLACPGSVWHV